MVKGAVFEQSKGILKDRGVLDLEPQQLPDGDLQIDHPIIGGDMLLPAGVTTIRTPARFWLRSLTVDVPEDVELQVKLDGRLFFQSPGNEAGERKYHDNPHLVRSEVVSRFDNTGAADRQARVTYLGPVVHPEEVKQGIFGVRGLGRRVV